MRTAPFFATALLAACGAFENPRQAMTMDLIEQQVRLPKDAVTLDRYSRFYTAAKSGEVIGTYVAGTHDGLSAGRRRWVKDIYHLPAINDGECFIVNVAFDSRTKKVTQVFCNGIA